MKFRYGFLALLFLCLTSPAFAACSSPAGVDGQQIYNADHKVMQFCDGTDWISMAGGGGGGGSTPVGAVLAFAMSTPPEGWLEADGSAVSRTTYADLFAAIGTSYGIGDGSTTFNLPDLRGEFVRGWDNGRGVDSGRAIASTQTDELKSHSHLFNYGSSGSVQAASNYTNSVAGTAGTYSAGGAETRPRNVAMMYCVKY